MSLVDEMIVDDDVAEANLIRLSKDIRKSAEGMPRHHARYLVDVYYQIQRFRIRSGNQSFASAEAGEPAVFLKWTQSQMLLLEKAIRSGLGRFAASYRFGSWLQSITGIGPVISAGMIACIDWRRAEHAGNVWSFAGLNPSRQWLSAAQAADVYREICGDEKEPTYDQLHAMARRIGQHPQNFVNIYEQKTRGSDDPPREPLSPKRAALFALSMRPHSRTFKTLCVFHAGSCFIRVKGHKTSFYGQWYDYFRDLEEKQNERGEFKVVCERKLSEKSYGKSTEAYKAMSQGQLSKAHIHERARRRMVKLFLSHAQAVAWEDLNGRPAPRPYAEAVLQHGREHIIGPPNWPQPFDGKPLRELYR